MTAGLTSVHDVVLVGGSTHIKFSTQESASQELVVLYLTHTEDIFANGVRREGLRDRRNVEE